MASSPGNTNPQTPPFDLHNFFKPSANSHLAPAASYPPQAGSFLHNQHHQNLYMPSPVALAGAQLPQSPQANLQQQRSLPYPTLPPNLPSPRGNHNAGTHILALLTNNNAGGSGNAVNSQDLPHQQLSHEMLRSFPGGSGPIRVPSGKLPTGRRLVGDHVEYDVDKRIPGEVQPQLEVTPITKYGSDPQLVVGRQIAVNKFYICYGLKGGNVRVLNINTALRSLFRGHTQRVSDMAFFAEDIHLLASVSIEGRVFAWKISEGSEGEDQPQITGGIVLAVHILGEGDAKHPRICWHCHKQEILIVSTGKSVLRIDTNKVGKGEVYSAEAPLQCPLEKLIDGIQLVGKHDGEVTDLSMCQWLTTRLVSSSLDGTIKIWDDRKAQPLAVLRPHDGHPVQSATFLTAPVRPDHIILITGGSLNRELKIWVLESEEGWLLPSDAESWKCTQTLDLKSSSEQAEEAFFNQIVALSQAGLLLLANAKRNAIYVVHLDYALCPVQSRMDYITEFTVTIPILSFTGTNDYPDEHVVRVYCVQTQAIQQYTLDLCQCLPPPLENMGIEKSDSDVSREVTSTEGCSASYPYGAITTELPLAVSAPKPSVLVSGSERTNAMRYPESSGSMEYTALEGTISNDESRTSALASASCDAHTVSAPPPVPLSPSLSSKHSDGNHSGIQPVTNYSVDGQIDTIQTKLSDVPSFDGSSRSGELKLASDDSAAMHNSPMLFKRPTHLITPSEILMMAVTSADPTSATKGKNTMDTASIQDIVVNTDVKKTELDGKEVCRSSSSQIDGTGNSKEPQNQVSQSREKIFYSQASNLSTEMARERYVVSEESYVAEESSSPDQSSQAEEGEVLECRGVPAKFTESVSLGTLAAASTNKGKKERSKSSQGLTSPSSSTINLADSSNEQGHGPIFPPPEPTQFLAMQETLNQLLMSQKEMQKQLSSVVNAPVKEGKRLELALGRMIERVSKASTDALWAQVHEELVRSEKLSRDHSQETINVMTNYMNKELNASFERVIKKEFAAIGPAVVRAISPAIEKTVTSTIADSFQKGVGDKTVNQLEKTVGAKLEATVARQIQAQFQTTGRQALQEALKSALEASLIPAFEMSCKTMFEQIDATFQKGISEHAITAQQHFESAHSQLALALREAINSASSVAHTLSQELVEGQRKLLALAASSAASGATNLLSTQTSGGPLGGLHEKFEAPLDPTKELSRLIFEGKYEEALTSALQRSDVSIVSWLCSQVDLHRILGMVPLPLSQGVLLSLLQQLACDLGNDVQRKLAWMTDVAAAINPADQMIAVHARPVLEQVYQILHHQRGSSPGTGDLSSIRLLIHVINSMLMSCK